MQAPEGMTESGEKPKKQEKRKHHDHARDGISIKDVWKTCERRSGKHGRRREVPIQDELADLIAAMRPAKRDDWGNKVVIVPRLRIQHMRSLAEKAKVAWDRGDDAPTGLPRRLGWHSARHTAASLLSACGVDGVALQLALGHHSRDLTVHYAKARAQYGRDIENEKWPRGAVCLIKPPVPQVAKPATAKPEKPAVK